MVAAPSIAKEVARFEATVSSLRTQFGSPTPDIPPFDQTCPPIHDDARQMLVVHLQNGWALFCMELLRISAIGNSLTRGGTRLPQIALPAGKTSVIRYFRTLSAKVAQTMPNRAENPIWHDPAYIVRLANALAPGNRHEITLGIGGSVEATNMNTVRNHIIHSGHQAGRYQEYAQSIGAPRAMPAALLLHPASSGRTVFETWLSDLELAAQVAAT